MTLNFTHNLADLARSGGFRLIPKSEFEGNQIDWRFIGERIKFYCENEYKMLKLLFQLR
jgi:hypothetical protein